MCSTISSLIIFLILSFSTFTTIASPSLNDKPSTYNDDLFLIMRKRRFVGRHKSGGASFNGNVANVEREEERRKPKNKRDSAGWKRHSVELSGNGKKPWWCVSRREWNITVNRYMYSLFGEYVIFIVMMIVVLGLVILSCAVCCLWFKDGRNFGFAKKRSEFYTYVDGDDN